MEKERSGAENAPEDGGGGQTLNCRLGELAGLLCPVLLRLSAKLS